MSVHHLKYPEGYRQEDASASGRFSAVIGCHMKNLKYLPHEFNAEKPDVVQLVKFHNLKYIDKRSSGGALWVTGGRELLPTMLKLRDSGFPFTFKVGGGRSSNYKDAWWYKSCETASMRQSVESKEVQPVYTEHRGVMDSAQCVDFTFQELCPQHAGSVTAAQPNSALDPEFIEKLTDVLTAHFANGYRLNSPIDLARFRSFATKAFGEEIVMLPHEALKRYITACGTPHDGKVYAVLVEAKEQIIELADEYFSEGAQAIFFTEFYTKNENWLFEASVVSEDMLIDISRRLFPKLSFTRTYFGYTDASAFSVLEGEILRVWGDDVLLTYGQLAERLRYIPFKKIKYALCQNGDFIWSSVETYTHVSRFKITDKERQIIRESAVLECNTRSYTSFIDLPLDEINERNYELSITALHDAVYRICLADMFEKKGKIVTRKGDVVDALTIMKGYCRTIDKCSLDDLLNFERELTGEVHRWLPIEAGNTVLVRIGKDTYVADRYVHFNIDVIDEAIGLFVKGDYIPLKSFTTFGTFPDCGQTWNLFLLESYCRRFSRKFRFDASSPNSRNAGAVIKKDCRMDYTEIMSNAVANANVSLKDTVVGKFLYESGYTGRSTTAKVREVIIKAIAIQDKRD